MQDQIWKASTACPLGKVFLSAEDANGTPLIVMISPLL